MEFPLEVLNFERSGTFCRQMSWGCNGGLQATSGNDTALDPRDSKGPELGCHFWDATIPSIAEASWY